MIPMEELEGRMDGEAHRLLVKSSAAAGKSPMPLAPAPVHVSMLLVLCRQV